MGNATPYKQHCPDDKWVAYLDGALDDSEAAELDAHLSACGSCAATLRLERQLQLELDSVLLDESLIEVPEDFARVVAARARSDISGVRSRAERRRALGLCAMLLALSFLLLGATALGSLLLAPLRVAWKCAAALASFLGHALYDAGAGLAVLSRGVGLHLLFESRGLRLAVLLLLGLAFFALSRLIVRYHRARIVE